MDKLVCVEYNAPTSRRGSNGSNDRHPLPLSGFVGETLESFVNNCKQDDTIPVRFPLLGAGSRVSLLGNDRDLLDPYQLSLEGESLNPAHLYVLERKTPVSTYTRIPMGEEESLFEVPNYMSTYSLTDLLKLLKSFDYKYRHRWVWKTERASTGGCDKKYRHIFGEARVYGIDAAINTYSGNRFGGVAVEIIYKPQPTKEMIKQGIMVMRSCSDLLLFGHSEEYISYIDGIQVRRESIPHGWGWARYSEYITPKEVVSLGRFREYHKANSTVKEVAEPKKTERPFKDAPPPTKASRKWSQPTAASTGATLNTGMWIGNATTTTTGAK